MPDFVLYCAIYLFSLLLKAIAAGQQISQKIEQLFLLDFEMVIVYFHFSASVSPLPFGECVPSLSWKYTFVGRHTNYRILQALGYLNHSGQLGYPDEVAGNNTLLT